ncbi:hypothetical protein HJ135_05100 [Vibrio parahaemolyticus]|nr:hypothetical protein [Vibrio parahaemolyticus]
MNKLATKRLKAIVSLLNDLELISQKELPEEQHNALCINVNGWRYYPSFQFDEHFNLIDNLRNNLSLMREGRDDTDILYLDGLREIDIGGASSCSTSISFQVPR